VVLDGVVWDVAGEFSLSLWIPILICSGRGSSALPSLPRTTLILSLSLAYALFQVGSYFGWFHSFLFRSMYSSTQLYP
jgi:hypothetical protein